MNTSMIKIPKRKKMVGVGLLIVADLIFFSLVDPTKAYAIVLVGGFGLLMVTIFALFDLSLTIIERFIPLSQRAKRRTVGILTGLVGLLIAMQSIGQLTVRDVLALLPLLVVAVFYISYMGKQKA